MSRKVVAFLQARSDSSRLPKKVLKPILNIPMIIHQLNRVSRSKLIDELYLLSSLENNDDALVNIVDSYGYKVFRGSRDNVLERFYKCATSINLKPDDVIVRLTGDCPLHSPIIIDELIESFLNSGCDYMANCINPIYPDGFDTEVFLFSALKEAYKKATKLSQKEHVTPYIRDSGEFKICNLEKEPLHNDWRLTVDEPEDLIVVEKIFEHFKRDDFTFQELIDHLEKNKEILKINSSINRNEGYLKSLKEDEKNG